ncbi:HIT family protein [Undibacterium sp. RTI2.2]|uniref:HIT family protein n=1 Tax=Undibacterium sp. 5I1 TaxID=3048590 RepID=UPI002AB4481C|nr:HIT family protein [Undibacterium sp. 5I1]MDY7540308.1 HIT family protein [Undibacterium sp. 5I1]MEB0118076.1 HIT family protein [Undibacterium sp. RTI2.2]
MKTAPACELCDPQTGEVIFASQRWRVLLVDDANYPGFCRVVWNDHIKEMTDLPAAERHEVMDAVWHVEWAIREVMQPHKINLASFGNMVPHLHWHIIPRYTDDLHFPNPVWAQAKVTADAQDESALLTISARQALLPGLKVAIINRLSQNSEN